MKNCYILLTIFLIAFSSNAQENPRKFTLFVKKKNADSSQVSLRRVQKRVVEIDSSRYKVVPNRDKSDFPYKLLLDSNHLYITDRNGELMETLKVIKFEVFYEAGDKTTWCEESGNKICYRALNWMNHFKRKTQIMIVSVVFEDAGGKQHSGKVTPITLQKL